MRQDDLNKIIEKAKTKNDGVYSMNGISYRVRDNNVTHCVDYNNVLGVYGHFVTQVGSFDRPHEAKKALKQLKD